MGGGADLGLQPAVVSDRLSGVLVGRQRWEGFAPLVVLSLANYLTSAQSEPHRAAA